MSLRNARFTRHPILTLELFVAMQLKTTPVCGAPTVAGKPGCRLSRSAQATYGESFRNRRSQAQLRIADDPV